MDLSGEILEHRIRKPFVPCVGAETDAVRKLFQLFCRKRGNVRHGCSAFIADRGGCGRIEEIAVFDGCSHVGVVRAPADQAADARVASAGNRSDGKAGLYGAVDILADDAADVCAVSAGNRSDVQTVFNGSVGGIADNSAGFVASAGDRAGVEAVLDRFAASRDAADPGDSLAGDRAGVCAVLFRAAAVSDDAAAIDGIAIAGDGNRGGVRTGLYGLVVYADDAADG